MLWKILRPRYWILDRKVRAINKAVLLGAILLLAFGGQWVYDNLIRDYLAYLGSEQAASAVATFLPLGLASFLLFALLGLGDTMGQLYLAPDLELLMVAPVSYRAIFAVKLLQCSRAAIVPGLTFGAFLLALGIARDAAIVYYPLVVALILSTMILTTSVIMILVIALARFVPPQKVRTWMPVTAVLVTAVLATGSQWITRWLVGQEALLWFFGRVLSSQSWLALAVTGVGGLALATSLAASWAFGTSFYEGWNRFREVPARRGDGSRSGRRAWGMNWLARPLPAPLRHLVVKEWLDLRRNPRNLINLGQPLVLIAVILSLFLGAGKSNPALYPLRFWAIWMFLPLLIANLPLGTSLMAVAQEGNNIDLLRSTPTLIKDALRAKVLVTWVPMALSWWIALVLAGLWMRFSLLQIGLLVGVSVWGLAGASAMTTALGGLTVDFAADQVKRRVPWWASSLAMGLNLVFVLLTIATAAGLALYLFPESGGAVGHLLAEAGGEAQAFWGFAELLLVPLNIQAVFWIGMKLLWDAAVRRLERWEKK